MVKLLVMLMKSLVKRDERMTTCIERLELMNVNAIVLIKPLTKSNSDSQVNLYTVNGLFISFYANE